MTFSNSAGWCGVGGILPIMWFNSQLYIDFLSSLVNIISTKHFYILVLITNCIKYLFMHQTTFLYSGYRLRTKTLKTYKVLGMSFPLHLIYQMQHLFTQIQLAHVCNFIQFNAQIQIRNQGYQGYLK